MQWLLKRTPRLDQSSNSIEIWAAVDLSDLEPDAFKLVAFVLSFVTTKPLQHQTFAIHSERKTNAKIALPVKATLFRYQHKFCFFCFEIWCKENLIHPLLMVWIFFFLDPRWCKGAAAKIPRSHLGIKMSKVENKSKLSLTSRPQI